MCDKDRRVETEEEERGRGSLTSHPGLPVCTFLKILTQILAGACFP